MDDGIKLCEKTNTGETGNSQVHDSTIKLIVL